MLTSGRIWCQQRIVVGLLFRLCSFLVLCAKAGDAGIAANFPSVISAPDYKLLLSPSP
jgi:hypothetical protein